MTNRAECVFCRIADGTIPSTKVYENADFIAFRDVNPVAPTHILVIPRQHISNISEATDPLLTGRLIHTATQVAASEKLINGYRWAINNGEDGGQTVRHLHLHLLAGRPMTWPPG